MHFFISASFSYHFRVQAFVSASAAVFGSEDSDPPFQLVLFSDKGYIHSQV